ncbi:hypothetical protein [Streptomyces halobius]|uniref:Uncharacterized protein n=1 Tax=Streptomyces halobius TaxID=2879846 RepID=A0ABY4MHP2_9ACTN|nr:hypothetical protein [Streptomyces halobius]UQA95876.1 hypothetical protein K9S39_31985 [Streptomyces halobius]
MGSQEPGAAPDRDPNREPHREPGNAPVPAAELRARFQERSDAAVASGGRTSPESARRGHARIALVVAAACLVITGLRLLSGAGLGAWMAIYLGAAALGALGSVLARNGRTRCAAAAIAAGVVIAAAESRATELLD